MRNFAKRLDILEERIRPNPLTVLARTATGELMEMTARECIERGFGFVKVVDGHNLHDLDMILDYILHEYD